tara:strand:- start:2391 stop:2933 length:543 start_codon:yes stop_codon:yes gene_type:complete
MNYENINNEFSSFSFQKQNLFCMLGLYLFSLGSNILGYSAYLFLESFGLVDQKIISWNGQGLFWFLILFSASLFILFIPIEFLNEFKIQNKSFRDLLINIISVILISLISLVFFQFFLNGTNQIIFDLIEIGKATSFSGFISIPLMLFMHHTAKDRIIFSNSTSFSFILLAWILSSQLFL